MGSSKSFKKAPAWQDMNTNRGKESYSTGTKKGYEGSIISGGEKLTKRTDKGRDKSSSSKSSVKNPGPHGYS